MDLLHIASVLLVLYLAVQLVRLLLSDCDLILQWTVWLGKKPDTLCGKVVWITGASSGIGEYLAYELAAAGCRLVLSARRQSELERVKKRCLTSGPVRSEDVLVLPLDMTEFDSHVEATQKVLKHFKQIDVLVNNAGRSQRALFKEVQLEVDREMLDLNVLGPVSLSKAVLPHMLEHKAGHIVNMSSVAGKLGAPNSSSYTGAKHALQGYFDCLRIELGGDGIHVTNICPGPVVSNILDQAFTSKKGETYGGRMNEGEKRVSTERCAFLSAVAIANCLDEVWISLHPILLFLYLNQYMPAFSKRIAVRMGMKQIAKMRQGE